MLSFTCHTQWSSCACFTSNILIATTAAFIVVDFFSLSFNNFIGTFDVQQFYGALNRTDKKTQQTDHGFWLILQSKKFIALNIRDRFAD